MSTPTILAIGPALVCGCSWIGVGAAVPRRLLPESDLRAWVTRLAVGTLVWSLGLLALGRLHAFSPTGIVALTAVAAAVGAAVVARTLLRLAVRLPRDRLVQAAVAFVVLALLVDLVASTAPPTSADALKYHLALPRLWLQRGAIGDPFWRWEGFQPSGVEMLYAQALALAGGAAAGAVGGLLAVVAALAVFGAARRLGGLRAGLLAAALFVLQGLVTWEATSSFVELGLTFYVCLAFWWALDARSAEPRRALAWCGLAAGAAAGTKFLGLVGGGVVVALAVAAVPARHRLAAAAGAAGAAVLAGGAWYLRNGIVTGNPVYPSSFGGKMWTPYAQSVLDDVSRRYGTGSILRLPILPLDLLLNGDRFDRGQYASTATFVLAPFALLARPRSAIVLALCGVAVYLVAWFEVSPQARFLLPALAVLACLGGVAADRLLARGAKVRVAAAAVLAAAVVAWLVPSVVLVRQLLPPVAGAEGRTAFLQRLVGTQLAFDAIARRTHGTVGFQDYDFVFNFPGRAITLGVPEFARDVPTVAYRDRLRGLGIHYLVTTGTGAPAPPPHQVAHCVRRLRIYPARFVTSRSKGTGYPIDLTLYALRGCSRRAS